MKAFFLVLLLLSLTSCYTIERECVNFKTGTFEFNYMLDGVEKTGRFVRTETLNIDFYEGKIDSSSLRWINDCEFILKKIHPKGMAEKEAIHMKILSTTNNSYTFEYKLAVKKPNKPIRLEKGVAKKIN